ncbi:hypothetical protein SAMN06264348_102427 [Oceanospirillum linum]|nr:hypothetical protein SAMN04489856_103113 [Oleiphilus messinensis]SMP13151.1 hypothetical protein SAMN06264348_102427 [Oceanospirillum linum]
MSFFRLRVSLVAMMWQVKCSARSAFCSVLARRPMTAPALRRY